MYNCAGILSRERLGSDHGLWEGTALTKQRRNTATTAGDERAHTPESPRVLARRRRTTSAAVTTSLAIVAVLLTAGGIAAPQIMYAREAANFHGLAADVNRDAKQAATLSQRASAETLLLELRGDEAKALPGKLTALLKHSEGVLSPEFKRDIAEAATQLTEALTVTGVAAANAPAAKKALSAREAELPDPRSWFDIDPELLAYYADLAPEGAESVETDGTITLERVQQVKRLHESNAALAAKHAKAVDRLAEKNAALAEAMTAAEALIVAEAQRAATAILDALPAPVDPAVLEEQGLDPQPAERAETAKLRAAATELRTRAGAEQFAVTADGAIVGSPAGAEAAEGSMRIPGGAAVRIRYVMPALRELIAAHAADRKAGEAATALAEAEAAEAAARQQAANAQQGSAPLPDSGAGQEPDPGGGQPQTPTPTPSPTQTPPLTDPGTGSDPGSGGEGGH